MPNRFLPTGPSEKQFCLGIAGEGDSPHEVNRLQGQGQVQVMLVPVSSLLQAGASAERAEVCVMPTRLTPAPPGPTRAGGRWSGSSRVNQISRLI